MSLPPDHTPATPRWTTLALLGTAVLGLHLALLVGDLSSLAAPPNLNAPTTTATATAEPHRVENAAPPAQLAQPPRATTSTVRWIVEAVPSPAPSQPPTPKPVPRVETPKPSPLAAPPMPPPTPLPAETRDGAVPTTDDSANAAGGAPLEDPTAQPPVENAAPIGAPEAEPGTDVAASPPQAPAAPEARANTPPLAPAQPQPSEPRPPAQPPASTQLAYDVTGNVKGLNYSARGTLAWTFADGQYSARMEVRLPLLGSRVQTSAGRVDGTGLLPERFSDKSRSERAAHFDHTRQTIRFSNNRPDASLQAGAQDRLSLFMQLAGLLQAQPSAYPEGHIISLPVAGTSDAEIWRFRVAEEDTLALPAGALRARRLVREPREPRDSLIDIWLAPELAHLPVRIRITQDNGDRMDQQLSQMP